MKLINWAILLAFSFAVSTAQATSIVIRKTANDIFAGADSKMSFSTGQPDTVVDKIIEIKPKWYFTAAGHADISDGRSVNFNVFNTVRSCQFVIGTSLKEFTNLCIAQISSDLRTPLQSLARSLPDLYFREYGDRRILELVFFGQENGSLVAYERALFADLVGTGFTSVKSVDCEATCSASGAYGLFEHIIPTLRATPDYWKMGSDRAICSLIGLEMDRHPESIGWPIKVLHLTARGKVEWFIHEKTCDKKRPQLATPKPRKRKLQVRT